jgi:hypothetical protein
MSIRNDLLEKILSASGGGGSLDPEQTAAVQSIIDAPDDTIMLARSGVLAPSQLKQESLTKVVGETQMQLFNKGETMSFGEQFSITEAGGGLMQRDVTTGKRDIFAGSPVDFSATGDQKVTGNPYSIEWGEINFDNTQPLTEATRQGNYSFPAPVTFTRVISQINFKLLTQVTGVRLVISEASAGGVTIFKSHTDAEWESGAGVDVDATGMGIINLLDPEQGTPILVETTVPLFATIEKYGDDSDLTLVGTTLNPAAPGLFLPFQTQNYFTETRSELVNSKIYTPIYKQANSSDLTINNMETIAADADVNGAFSLTVDVTSVSVFWVFDYAGGWNGGSRRIDIILSNGDTYQLTRKNRKYFFYKDEADNWQWYYQSFFMG